MIKIHIIRVAFLLALFTVGLLSLFAMPMDDSPTWYSDLLLSKGLAAACLWAFGRLYKRWKETDSWVRAYDRWNGVKCQ